MDLLDRKVSLLACESYDADVLETALSNLLGAHIPSSLHGKRVLLKPNLISAKKNLLACTDGRFIVATARFFLEQGAKVLVGDSPAYGTCRNVLAQMNLLEQLDYFGVRIVEFDRVAPTDLASGQRVGIAKQVLESDYLVNLPRIKAHGQLRVTLGVKNCFGCVGGLRKAMLHMTLGDRGDFQRMLAALLQVLPDSISIADGITAMHKTGPIDGKPFPLGLTAAAANPVALDTAVMKILRVDPELNPVWHSCKEFGYRGINAEDLEFLLQSFSDFHVRGFRVPVETNPIRFSLLRFVKGNAKRLMLRLQRGS